MREHSLRLITSEFLDDAALAMTLYNLPNSNNILKSLRITDMVWEKAEVNILDTFPCPSHSLYGKEKAIVLFLVPATPAAKLSVPPIPRPPFQPLGCSQSS